VEPVVSHSDVSTIMDYLAYIRDDVRRIREEVVDDDGEEDDSERDA
jgi:hypothetical protein